MYCKNDKLRNENAELHKEIEGLKIDLETEQDEVELKQACIKGMGEQADKLNDRILEEQTRRFEENSKLRTEILAQNKRIELLEGVIRVDDERLRKAGDSVGIDVGCDTAHWMADEILGLRKKLDEAIEAVKCLRTSAVEFEDARMKYIVVQIDRRDLKTADDFLATVKTEDKK
jgi:cell division septum initiation protein DivIVA